MASSSSYGPVRRNFGNGPSKRSKKAVRAFFLVLVALVVALSVLAVRLSRQLALRHEQSSPPPSNRHSPPWMADVPEKKTVTRSVKAADVALRPPKNIISPPNDAQKDRVYCMIPFIWNEEIYKAIMDTWGKRCDVINFLTDAIVGGKLMGDKITDDPKMEYKPYWEYPKDMFPPNVVFINMTRTWNDCPEDKNGVKKVCRHIWEKM